MVVSQVVQQPEQGLRPGCAFVQAEAEMGGDHVQRSRRRGDLGADGAARLTLGIGQIVDLARPAASG